MNLAEIGALTFEAVDHERFPALRLCVAAGEAGSSTSAALCASDEVAVDAFVNGRIRFVDIPTIIAKTLDRHSRCNMHSLDDVEAVLIEAGAVAQQLVAAL